MEPKRTVKSESDLQGAIQWVYDMSSRGLKAGPVVITLGRETRTEEQNDKQWPMLRDISTQVEWFGQKHSPEDWKDILSAAWKGQKLVPGVNGGFVALGVRTSRISKEEFSEYIESIYAFGAERSVVWSDKALEAFEKYREAR
jgi:hypothetical protein